jgi:hypothetical protein
MVANTNEYAGGTATRLAIQYHTPIIIHDEKREGNCGVVIIPDCATPSSANNGRTMYNELLPVTPKTIHHIPIMHTNYVTIVHDCRMVNSDYILVQINAASAHLYNDAYTQYHA